MPLTIRQISPIRHIPECKTIRCRFVELISLLGAKLVPMFGRGTWKMGKGKREPREDNAVLRLGINQSMKFINTATLTPKKRTVKPSRVSAMLFS